MRFLVESGGTSLPFENISDCGIDYWITFMLLDKLATDPTKEDFPYWKVSKNGKFLIK